MAKTLIITILLYSILANSQELLFRGFKGDTNITTNGVAVIEQNGLLRLTNDTHTLGHAFYSTPIKFKNSTNDNVVFSFSTAFAFAIKSRDPRQGGHGLAFAIFPSKELGGAYPNQYLGLFKPHDVGNFSNHIFAVEFDTVMDYELYDINDNHVGVNVNSVVSNKSVPAAYFTDGSSKQNLNLKSGRVIQAWVDYDSSTKQLDIRLSLTSSKPSSPILSYEIDLSPILLDYMYVGFSSSTGLLASSHYILGWSFKMNGEAKSLHLGTLPSLPVSKNRIKVIMLGLGLVLSFSILTIIVAVYVIRKMKNGDVIEPWELEVGPHRFSCEELKQATKGFKEKQLIGFGGFGRVYKGVLSDSNAEVAVKRITQNTKEGLKQFMSEIATIGRLRHRNIVQLRGWCRKRCDLLLVYDFMENGSLDKYLFDEPKRVLSWEQRFKIIKQVACGLVYLHQEWEQAVIHRDIKAGNVLLDSEMNGRVGDFGLAKMYEHGENAHTTRVVGTLGYLAPELTRTGKPTTSSDVFAFGALMLEVACGRRPFEPKALPDELILVDWVRDRWRVGKVLEVMDMKLGGVFDRVQALTVLRLGLMCSNDGPQERPTMRQVVMYLEGEMQLPDDTTTSFFDDKVSMWSCTPQDIDASSLSLSGDTQVFVY